MLQALLLAGIFLAAHVGGVSITYTIDCAKYPSVCNHKCYAVYVAGKTDTFDYAGPLGKQKSKNRRASGAAPNPCKPSRNKAANCRIKAPTICYFPSGAIDHCVSPDEYPYASTPLGGQGSGSALLRCTGESENTEEGSKFGGAVGKTLANGGCGKIYPCSVTMAFKNLDARSPYCTSRAGPNDGFEWEYKTKVYNLAKRDEDHDEDLVQTPTLHVPHPVDFHPLHERREFLLDNGERAIVASRDATKSWDGEMFTDGVSTSRVVRELFGMEKSGFFRPTNVTIGM